MHSLLRFLIFIRWPVVTGLLASMAVLLFYPSLLPTKHTGSDPAFLDFSGLEPKEQWHGPVSYAAAVSKASPSVVNIYTRKQSEQRSHPYFTDPFFRRFLDKSKTPQQPKFDLGSGVIVTSDGYLLTNNHVISDAEEIVVSLQDGRDAQARIVGTNQKNDLAVLKIDLDNLRPISMGSAETAQVGDVVLAIGNPFGVGQTVTQGIISATRRRGLNIADFENFIQTDAAINPGNSGGALIDSRGQLLGISTANLAQSGYTGGIGFAIPADTAMQTLQDIIEHGRVVRGWLGVDVEGLAIRPPEGQTTQRLGGFLITGVNANSPAARAGLKAMDIIIRINDKEGNNLVWGEQEIAESRPGDRIEIEIIRDGQVQVVGVVLGENPSPG